MASRLLIPWSLLAGLLIVAVTVDGLKATALVLGKLKPKVPTDVPSTDKPAEELQEGDVTEVPVNASTRSPLTGIPQKDYIHDPNLPRELNGYNLTEYPFYDRVPDELDFKCDGLHDGFYASVLHKCQVYHHCLFGTRYDFLCANYTAFDQKTFICHFVSEVDCENSPKYFKRNEALYKAASSSTTSTTTTTTTQAPPPPPPPVPARRPQGGRRRPSRRRRPVYEYYYDDDDYEDGDYYDDELPLSGKDLAPTGPGRHNRNRPRRPVPTDDQERRPSRIDDPEPVPVDERKTEVKPRPSGSVYDRPRVPPRIRRPVPKNERDKYDYNQQSRAASGPATVPDDSSQEYSRPSQQTSPKSVPATKETDDTEYYDEEEEYVPPIRSSSNSRNRNPDYYPPTAERDVLRRPAMSGGRNVRRRGPGGRRRYVGQVETATPYVPVSADGDDDYEDEDVPRRAVRPSGPGGRRRTQISQQDVYSPVQPQRAYGSQQRANVGQASRYKYDDDDDEPVPAPRPAYISPSAGGRQSYLMRKRVQPQHSELPYDEYSNAQSKALPPVSQGGLKRPENKRQPTSRVPTGYATDLAEDDDYYYDDEFEDPLPIQNSRPRQSSRDSTSTSYGATAEGEFVNRQTTQNRRPFSQLNRPDSSSLSRSSQTQPGRFAATGSANTETNSEPLPRQATGKVNREDDVADQTSNYQPKNVKILAPTVEGTSSPVGRGVNTPPSKNGPVNRGSDPEIASTYKHFSAKEDTSDIQLRTSLSGYSNFRAKSPFLNPNSRNADSKPSQNPENVVKEKLVGPYNYSSLPTTAELSPVNSKSSGSNQRFVSSDAVPSLPITQQPKSNSNIRVPSKVVIKPVERDNIRLQNVPDDHNLADLNDHEIDDTINDALHPTLHPTRSITSGFVPQTQEETQRGIVPQSKRTAGQRYQPQAANGSRGSTTYFVTSASQRYVTKTPYDVKSNEGAEYEKSSNVNNEQTGESSRNTQYNQQHSAAGFSNVRHQQNNRPVVPLVSEQTNYRISQSERRHKPFNSQESDSDYPEY